MKTKKITISFFVATLTVLLVACGKPVQLDVKLKEAQSQINIFGRLDDNPDTKDQVLVRKSVSYLHPADSVQVSDATVTVKDETGNLWLFTYDNDTKAYLPPNTYTGISLDHTYTLEVLHKGVAYVASSKAERISDELGFNPFAKDSVEKRTDENTFGDDTSGYNLALYFADDPKVKNYYYMNVYRNDTLLTATDPNRGFTMVYQFDDKYLSPGGEPVRSDLFERFKFNDKVKIDLFSIDFQTYKYYEALSTQTNNGGSIFDGPPANIIGNISNGALGYFYVSSSVTDTLTIRLK